MKITPEELANPNISYCYDCGLVPHHAANMCELCRLSPTVPLQHALNEGEVEVSHFHRDIAARYQKERDDEWRRECAMEAGMAFGVDAYNDYMGYSTDEPDE